jgi:hypothetical protein
MNTSTIIKSNVALSSAATGGATIGGGNAKTMGLEPDTDGLPEVQIIIHDRNAAHGGLLALVPCAPVKRH